MCGSRTQEVRNGIPGSTLCGEEAAGAHLAAPAVHMDAPRAVAVPTVVGRDPQRAILREVLLRGHGPRAVVVSGEPGIGKTMLFNEVIAAAAGAGHRCLVARCFDEEMTGAVVTLGDLLVDVADVPAGILDPDIHVAVRGRALLELLADLSRDAPVVIGVDDQQWMDELSARTLRHVVRRLGDRDVALLATTRPDGRERDPMAIESGLGPDRASIVELAPLGLGELRRVLQDVVADRAVSPMTLHRIHGVSGGNPMYAVAIVRSLTSSEVELGLSPSLPLPGTLQDAMRRRLGTLDRDVLDLLEFLAIAGPVPLHHLVAHDPLAVDGGLVGTAVDLELVTVDEHGRCRLAHPMLVSTIYERIDPQRRRMLHAGLADVVEEPEARARHLALSTTIPDAAVAELLEQAAERAHVRGSPDTAAMFARHSLRLTPADDRDLSRRRALIESTALAAAGEVSRAGRAVDRLLASLPPGPERCDALLQRFYVASDPPHVGTAILHQALREAGDDQRLRGHVLDILGWHTGVFAQDLTAGIRAGSEALAAAEATGDRHLWVRAAGHLGHMRAMAGRPDEELMRRAMDQSVQLGGPALGGGPHAWWAKQLLWAGDLDGCGRILDQVVAWEKWRGYRLERSYRLYDLALLACARGDLDRSERLVGRGREEAVDSGNLDSRGWLLYPEAIIAAWRGRADEAGELVDRMGDWNGTAGTTLGRARGLGLRGWVELARGRPVEAIAHLDAALGLITPDGLAHPGALPVLPDLVVAAAWAGRLEVAQQALARLGSQVGSLRQPRPLAQHDWARGVVLAANGEAGQALRVLARASDELERMGLVADAARCRLDEGRAARRAGQRTQSAESLALARAAFTAMGAPQWVARVDQADRRVVPVAGGHTLTAAQQRVVGLVAGGFTNREVAARAFMGVSTVEAHLTRIYRRLGIRSRTELVRMVANGDLDLGGEHAAHDAGVDGS